MNKAIQKMVMALAICGALITAAQAGSQPMGTRASRAMREPSGTAMAALRGNPPPKGKAPAAMRASAPKEHVVKAPAPARHTAKRHAAPARHHVPRHEIVRHAPPPPPARHHEPKHRHHHSNTLHTEDWCEIGASLLGGLVGGLIGASI